VSDAFAVAMTDPFEDPPLWLWMRVTEHQARELLADRVDDELKAMARCMIDWQWDLAKNAAKPLNFGTTKKKRIRA
jgi:hypothetical protein